MGDRGGLLVHSSTNADKVREFGGVGFSQRCLKRKPPQRPVKITRSVYCVFDLVGRTAKSRRGEAEQIVVPTWEKLPHEPFPLVFFFQSAVYQERLFHSSL